MDVELDEPVDSILFDEFDSESSTASDSESEQEIVYDDGETKIYDGASLVDVNYLFPESSIRNFVGGEKISLLVGVVNKGTQYVNISSLGAYLQSSLDTKLYIQNYTRVGFHVLVPPGGEGSFEYVFRPDPRIEPNEYHLSVDLYFHNNLRLFRSIAFNSTIELTEKSSGFNPQAIFSFFLVGLLFAAIAYFSLQYLRDLKFFKSKGKRVAPKAAVEGSDADDWGLSVHKPKAASKKD